MGRTRSLDVLTALLGTTPADPVEGTALERRLASAGHDVGPSRLLVELLRFESSGHVTVERDHYRFALTPLGEEAVYELGPGTKSELLLVMVDLVGYVSFTEEQGDDAAHRVARALHEAADDELRQRSGRVVKTMGDGVLGWLPSAADPTAALVAIAARCRRPDGSQWPVRAAVRRGRPISHNGDIFGTDVNLVARLCEAAKPGEILVSLAGADANLAETEQLVVRGVVEPVAIQRTTIS